MEPGLPRLADLDTGPGRREVLRVAGASLALAAAACDTPPEEWGAPLHARPRGVAIEDATYASILELDGIARGVLVRTRAGHPVKIEGNPAHPGSLGATDVFMESAVLSLHDPARSRHVRQHGRVARVAGLAEALVAMRGEGLRILTGPVTSPTVARLVAAVLARQPDARWHQWCATAEDNQLAGLGAKLVALPDLSRARCVLALGSGPLEHGPAQLVHARGWAAARAAGTRPLLIAVESTPGLTGVKADRRVALSPHGIETLARAIARELGLDAPGDPQAEAPRITALLRAAAPSALVMAGREQPPSVHALAQAINAALDSTAARLLPSPMARPESAADSMTALRQDIARGEVQRLLLLDVNPAHDAGFAAALARVPASLHLGLHLDETALASAWHLPMKHALESWGDARAPDGTAAIRQPACVPRIAAALSVEEVLARLAEQPFEHEAPVRATWPALDDAAWRAALEEGVIAGSAPAPVRAAPSPSLPPQGAAPSGLVALFAPDPHLWDGRFATEAWLRELPHPITKQAWGNAALMAPADAARLGIADGDAAALTLDGRGVIAPVILLPGQAEGVVTLPLGGGFEAHRLRDGARWIAPGLEIARLGRGEVIRAGWRHQGALPALPPGGAFAPPPPRPSLYAEWPYPGAAWAMTVDLDACIGCNACTLACQAENNTPVVGAEEVARGREMHWLRVELHEEQDGRGGFRPVPCMHCEKAPCEIVCPVNATVHDNEGLNLMVYARCIGTRTCSNNCPYKVRRFNWHGYARAPDALPVRNPEVPVRPRGVIEKCTYCQHRIANARSQADVEGRAIADGEVETACQRACPTRAITFGDMNDPESAVARAKRDGRNHALLGELGTRPRTTYLARIRAERA